MNKLPFIILITAFFFSCDSSPEQLSSSDRDEISQLINNQASAWNNGNIEGFMKGYWQDEGLRFGGRSGITYGWTQVLDNYRKGFPNREDMGRLSFKIDSIHSPHYPLATVDGQWTIFRSDTVGGRFILLLDRPDGGEWKIVEDHTW